MEMLQTLTSVDYVIIGLLLIGAIFGWVKGLVKILTGFLAFVAAFFIAGRYTATVMAWLNRTWGMEQRIADTIAAKIHLPADLSQVQASESSLGSAAMEYIKRLPLPDAYKETLIHRVISEPALKLADIPGYIADQLAQGVLSTLVFVLMVAMLGVGFTLLGRFLSDQIEEIPLVGTMNSLLGGSLIFAEVLVILALVVGLLVPTLSLYQSATWLRTVEQSQLTPILLTVYTWARSFLFGLSQGTFFAI